MVACLVPGDQSYEMMRAWGAFESGEDHWVGPPLLYSETVSVIRRLAFQGLLTNSEAKGIVQDFVALDIPTPVPRGLYELAYDIAERYSVSRAYDACYVALAQIYTCELLTMDKRLHKLAHRDYPLVRLMP
ncbi:MAG: type II toxin-antitoxin system VapC family toxin [Chloroflexi bacterium]|nr:type II toxin-antitoxin system VapC family toxin [Chloroflexota bacterium]